jgi:hypothetical protein
MTGIDTTALRRAELERKPKRELAALRRHYGGELSLSAYMAWKLEDLVNAVMKDEAREREQGRNTLYDVTLIEVVTRFVGETPVQCAVFHKRDRTAVTVRLRSEQMTDLAARLTQKVADEGRPWP